MMHLLSWIAYPHDWKLETETDSRRLKSSRCKQHSINPILQGISLSVNSASSGHGYKYLYVLLGNIHTFGSQHSDTIQFNDSI